MRAHSVTNIKHRSVVVLLEDEETLNKTHSNKYV